MTTARQGAAPYLIKENPSMRHMVISLSVALALLAPDASAQSLFDKLQGAIGSVTGQSGVTAGLREALKVGTERVVSSIGANDGFNADPAIHIPLPPQLQKVQGSLKKFGLSALADDVELRLNQAAEAAAPKTKN